MGKIITGIMVATAAGIVSLLGYVANENAKYQREYQRENMFSDTAIVKEERLHLSASENSYRILTKDERVLKYAGSEPETLKDLELAIEPEMTVDFTGYPDKNLPFKIHVTKITPRNPMIPIN